MWLFSKEKTFYFQQECEDKTGELINLQILEKVPVDDCIIAAEMIDVLFIYSELARILYMSNKELFRMVAMFVGTFEIFVQVSNTTKVIIQCIPVDEEMEEEVFSDMKVIGFKYKKKSTDEEIEEIAEWMLEYKKMCKKIAEHYEIAQKESLL
ncbi:hypothetical protein [Bacillus cereus]|uniref:hypothetical protein n=1 Tax=Bacillus cereus TaxID=1396 RepID=UPI0018F6730C|nr:hypothetical protein [Bacillus cereus]MBJ7987834.1 hypothetical protein [Bacillus cereus]